MLLTTEPVAPVPAMADAFSPSTPPGFISPDGRRSRTSSCQRSPGRRDTGAVCHDRRTLSGRRTEPVQRASKRLLVSLSIGNPTTLQVTTRLSPTSSGAILSSSNAASRALTSSMPASMPNKT